MSIEELEAKIRMLEHRIQVMEDIEAIKKLQRAYGFYLEHWMAEDLADLFADNPEAQLRIAAGEFTGKSAIRRFFRHGKENTEMPKSDNGEFLHQVMQLSGVVDVDPDGQRAKGRWYGFGANAFPVEKGVAPGWMNGVYEVEYIKEAGIWKLLKVRWCMTFHAPWTLSFVDEQKRVDVRMDRPHEQAGARGLRPTGEHEHTLYPSGFICAFHFKNPVSGRKTA